MPQEMNWYKPAPGEPYRPLVAFPRQLNDKLVQISPRWSSCTADFFTAYDPPRALKAAGELLRSPAPPPTAIAAGRPNPALAPSATPDPQAGGSSAGGGGPRLLPPIAPVVDQPKVTPNPEPVSNDREFNPEAHLAKSAAHEALPFQSPNELKNPKPDPSQEGDFEPGSNLGQGSDRGHKDIDPKQTAEINTNSDQKIDLCKTVS